MLYTVLKQRKPPKKKRKEREGEQDKGESFPDLPIDRPSIVLQELVASGL
jgi:hypothetical protein